MSVLLPPLSHEAGHACAMLHFDVQCVEIQASSSTGGGSCTPSRFHPYPDAESEILVMLAGGCSDRMLGSGTHPHSRTDKDGIPGDWERADAAGWRLAAQLGFEWTDRHRRLFVERTERLVREHEHRILWLARQLGEHGGRLDREDLARLCWESRSPLRLWKHLYAFPEPVRSKPTKPAAGGGVRRLGGDSALPAGAVRVSTGRGLF